MVKPEDLLAAGAYLAPKDKLKNEALADSISARVYRHPALGDRPVVRLTPDNLASGEDLTLEFLGFKSPEVVGPVAKRQRQALGFPGWALVNDPKHARFALALVKGFKKAVRKSKAKPGHGYDEFVETSKQLGSSVAHFLPSFWEQVGREFIALDNSTYASRAFGKAREAEKVHALKVDESTRQDAFLEFALAGAVSIKALTEYSKELLATHNAREAWTFFRELCVRRVLGGMPPWPAMFKDMQPLIKAAGLDLERETQSVLKEIIDSPAISRAAMGFWDSASKSVGQLVKNDPHVAGVLLNMIPQTSSWRNEDTWPWLDHLEAWGILQNAWQKGVASEAQPTGGAGAWFTRLLRSIERPKQRIYDLLQALAPRLKADKVPVDLYLKTGWRNEGAGDVDLLDLALELKVPVMDPAADMTFDLDDWAKPVDAGKGVRNRPRDPVSLIADKRFSLMLRNAVENAAGKPEFELAATGKVALKQARREWLGSLVSRLATGALPQAEESLGLIEAKAQRPIFQEFPEELAKLQQADLLSSITRTIQGGLLDEYGWPELERVFDSFTAKGGKAPTVYGAFPYLIVTDNLKVVVVQGNKTVLQAELRIPKGHKLEHLFYVDGDLLVWAVADYRSVCFWNSDPKPGDPEYAYFSGQIDGTVIDVPGGGTFVGEKVVHRGDKDLAKARPSDDVVSDGKHWWKKSDQYDQATSQSIKLLHEIDPVTGKRGRLSMPSFFEDFLKEGTKLDLEKSTLLPLGSSFEKSPLGSRNGLLGFRIRSGKSGDFRIEGIDGRAVETSRTAAFAGLLNQPGSNGFLPLEHINDYDTEDGFKIWDLTGELQLATVSKGSGYSKGQVLTLPLTYLHAFELRDAVTSKKLRSITSKQVQTLLDAEQQDFEARKGAKPTPAKPAVKKSASAAKAPAVADQYPQLNAALHKLLGASIHPRLLAGLCGVVGLGGETIRRLNRVQAQRAGEAGAEQPSDALLAVEKTIAPYLDSLSYQYQSVPNRSFLDTSRHLASFFAGEKSSVHVPASWFDVIKTLTEGLPLRLWSEYCVDSADKKWVPFAEAWSDLPFQNLTGWFRRFEGKPSDEDFMAAEYAELNALEQLASDDDDDDDDEDDRWSWAVPCVGKSSRFLIKKSWREFEVLEYSPDGKFESIPGLTMSRDSESISPPTVWNGASLRQFVELAKTRPLNIPPVDILQSVASAAKATPAEVALVWLGLPKFDHWSSNFMPTALREACQLKTKECSAAREALKSLPERTRHGLVEALLAGDPAELWENPPTKAAARLAAAWGGSQVDRIPLSPEWVKKITDALGYGVDNAKWLEALNAPEKSPLLNDKGNWSFQSENDMLNLVCSGESSSFDVDVLSAANVSIAMLAYGLPVGDPARHKMADVFRAATQALANPGLLINAGTHYEFNDKKVQNYVRLVESTVGKFKQQKTLQIADDGILVVGFTSDEFQVGVRTAKLTTTAQVEKVANQLQALFNRAKDEDDEDDEESSEELFNQLKIVRSADFAALVKRLEKSPVPNGSYEANPLLSAPDVVKQVVKHHQLTDNAAAYYLQLLALPDPTDKNIGLWNGWTTGELKKAAADLIKKKLVLEATRSRAGRKWFLPGGWEDLKSPHLPLETWKMPLYQMIRDSSKRATPILSRIVPLEPVHTLFAKAWKRITDGDVPRYEKVK